MADVSGNFCYKLSDEEIRQFICLRRMNDRLFTGSRNSARDGWTFIIEEMGLQDKLSPQQAGRKWENLKKTYKDLKAPQSGVSTEGGGDTAATWKWFSEMHEAIGSKPSVQPSVLIASCSENPSVAEREQPGSSADQPGSSAEQPGSSADQPGSSAEQPGSSAEQSGSSAEQPGSSRENRGTLREERRPKKRKGNDPILQFLMEEAEYARGFERRAEEREEKMVKLLEKIVDKM